MTSWTRDGQESQNWTLSKVGDWQATTRNGTTQTRTHSDVHETTGITIGATTTPLVYDKKGNLAKDENGQQYNWDQENRLITAVVGAATNGYVYDALGRRLGKTTADKVTTFIHDGAQVIDEYEAPRLASTTLGTPTVVGSSTVASNGTVTLVAGGTGIAGTADQGRYTYAMLSGNGTISAKVTSLSASPATAGLALRQNATANAIEATVLMAPNGTATFSTRSAAGGTLTTVASVTGLSLPRSLRLGKVGTTITASYLNEAVTPPAWVVIGSATTSFIGTITAGTIASAGAATGSATVNYSNLAFTGDVRTSSSPTLARRYVYGSYVDEALAMIVGTAKYYYHANHLYSVAALTNSAGAVVERYRYDAYGQRIVLAADGVTTRAASSYNQQIGFTGRYHDWETGLAYFRARYFDHNLGRFIGRDPLGYVDGMGLYGAYFVPNYVDPTGLFVGVPPVVAPPVLLPPPVQVAIVVGVGVGAVIGEGIAAKMQRDADEKVTPEEQAHRQRVENEKKQRDKLKYGDCTMAQWKTLQDEVKRACDKVGPRSCFDVPPYPPDPCPELIRRLGLNNDCAKARENINNTCYKGGDKGHQTAAEQAKRAAEKCTERIAEECKPKCENK